MVREYNPDDEYVEPASRGGRTTRSAEDEYVARRSISDRIKYEKDRAEREAKAANEAKAKREATKEAKERKADPLYDARKAARVEAEKGAVTKMVNGVKVTEYPAVEPVERRPTAQPSSGRGGGRGGGGGGIGTPSQLGGAKREFNPFKMKQGGKVSASSRGDGIAQRGKTKGRIV